jgi:drug/metabolite transporter (DMT)-like permease
VVGSFLGWALLGEHMTPLFFVGGALIALGIFLSRE